MKAHFDFYTRDETYLGRIKCKPSSAEYARLVASGYSFHNNPNQHWPYVHSLDMYQDRHQLAVATPRNYVDTAGDFERLKLY